MASTTVLIADHEPARRVRCRRLLQRDPTIRVVGEARNVPEAPSPGPHAAAPSLPATSDSPTNQEGRELGNLVDINKATHADLVSTLGLGKEDSDKLVKSRPYKTVEELITKAGIAKVTVDKIREKVTIGQ